MSDVLQAVEYIVGFIVVYGVAMVVCILLDKALHSSNKTINTILEIIYIVLMICVWVIATKIIDNIS